LIPDEKAAEGISMFAKIDKKVKEVKNAKDYQSELEIEKSKKSV